MKGLTMLKIALCALTFIVILVLVEGQKSSNTDLTIASESTATKTNKDIELSETANRGAAGRSNTRSRAKSNLPKGKPKSTKGKRKRRKGRKNNAVSKENDLPTDILRDTMLHMFGFNHMPTTTGEKPCDEGIDCNSNNPRSSRSSRTEGRRSINFKPTPPDFMLELYRSYSEDKDLMMLHLKSQGNTVRSFFPSPADPMYREQNLGKSITITPVPASNSEGESSIPVFLFNLSSIPNIEDLVAAEIRVDGGNTNSDRSVVVGVYAVRETECNDELDCDGTPSKMFNRVGKSLTLSSLSGSNSWSDSRLVNLAQKARRPGHVVVLKFDIDEGSNQRKRRHFDDDQTVAGDLPDTFYAHDHHETTRRSRREPNISPILDSVADDIQSTSIPMLIVYCNDPRSEAEAETQTSAPVIWRALGNITSAMKKVKRSAPMPDDAPPSDGNSTDKRTRDVSPRNTPYVVEKRKKRRKNKQVPGNTTSEEQTTQRRRRKNRKGRKKGRKNNKIGIKLHPSINAEREDDKCGRKSLHVKFEDIGWSDWIISPQYFDAYYCSGMCKLPDMKESQTTNHALIQAAVKTIAGNDGIPAPCCVPDKLMSLSVLFFDEDRNVVLKVFPNMSVKSCACR